MLVGRPLAELLHPRSREAARAAVARMACGEERFDCWRWPFQVPRGRPLWLEGLASNFLRDPRLGGILVYWRELL